MEGLFFIDVHRTAGGTLALQLLCATSSDSPTKKARLAPGQPVRPQIPTHPINNLPAPRDGHAASAGSSRGDGARVVPADETSGQPRRQSPPAVSLPRAPEAYACLQAAPRGSVAADDDPPRA